MDDEVVAFFLSNLVQLVALQAHDYILPHPRLSRQVNDETRHKVSLVDGEITTMLSHLPIVNLSTAHSDLSAGARDDQGMSRVRLRGSMIYLCPSQNPV
jgi:hypothetical protein